MASRRLEDLQPEIAELARRHVRTCAERGLDVLVYCTLRSPEEQARLFWQGRDSDQVERRARRLVRLGCPGLAEMLMAAGPRSGPKLTFAAPGESWHQYGLAYDCVPLVDGKAVWSTAGAAGELWQILGEAGQESGLEWAGTWRRFRELPHFQQVGGADVHEAMVERFGDVAPPRMLRAAARAVSESGRLRAALEAPNSVFLVLASGAGAADAAVSDAFERALVVADNLAPEIWRAFWVQDPAGLDGDLHAVLYPDGTVRQAVVLAQGTGLVRPVAATFVVSQLHDAVAIASAFAQG